MGEMRFWYPATISDIVGVNDSFDSCLLNVCYAGHNRNNSCLPKEVIERAIPTMAYCPLVANYNVDEDVIGGHDVAFKSDDDGGVRMINLTDAVGVIPENPQWFWKEVTEEDGSTHSYLCTYAILWKRTPVYDKLIRDGVTGQSMEITVKDGKMVDGDFVVDDFSFTAFCLLGDGVEPCFESASVAMFSRDDIAERLHSMMDDFKRSFAEVMTGSPVDNISPEGEEIMAKGGNDTLNMDELLAKYGLTMEDIDFDVTDMSQEELEEKFAAIQAARSEGEAGEAEATGDETAETFEAGEEEPEEEVVEDDNEDAPGGTQRQFDLTASQLLDGIFGALKQVMVTDGEWGSYPRYSYVDHDDGQVYVMDSNDWNLYGMGYSLNGDQVVIDFGSATRKKISFVDFDMGADTGFNYQHVADSVTAKLEAAAGTITELKQFKLDAEKAERESALEAVFAAFGDLADDERFITLKENCDCLSVQAVEDQCYAIRGRRVQFQFSNNENKPIKLPVENGARKSDEPYGGVFREFGIGQ